ncbi:DUF935 domain-containing protein [Burkholderia sp. Ac-20345]|uniref:DUF935 domain-containing protein n=1 Tax=Burkholderia sp. Ac-20345 TaxID=2703891 RepID=UPI00197BACE7|nr:DUF935 domain-containing protein [Burkholderia sp. Ac-20345]MBN3779954.1 DUF935 domain-containing protein [Burkholderia sp. Ac-20345]
MARIVDQFGRPIERAVLDEPQTVKVPWLTHQIAAHPARGLTPQRLNDILQEAEFGFLIQQHELFRDMEERDAHLYAEMMKRRRAVTKLDWDVQPPRNPSKEEENLTAFAREMLEDIPNFEDLSFDCLDGIGNGFSALERTWTRVENTWVAEMHEWRPQYWFQLDQATRTQIHLRDGTPDGAPLQPFGWILHRHKAMSGYTARQPLLRVLAWPYLFKNYAVGDLAEFLDIYGIPMRIGKYPQNATDEERMKLMRAVRDLGHNAAGIMPQSMAIEFMDAATGKEGPFLAMMNWCDRAESKAILGQTMSADAHSSGLGSGNAKLHGEVRTDIRDADCKLLAATLTAQLIYPLLALNKGFSDIRRCPRLVFDVSEAEDIVTHGEALPKLAAIGMQIPVKWAHERLRIPQPVDGEPVLKIDVADVQPLRTVKGIAAASAQAPATTPAAPASRPDSVQIELDKALDMLGKDLSGQAHELVRPALAAVTNSADFDSALAALSAEHADVDATLLIEALARAMFVVDIIGVEAIRRIVQPGIEGT